MKLINSVLFLLVAWQAAATDEAVATPAIRGAKTLHGRSLFKQNKKRILIGLDLVNANTDQKITTLTNNAVIVVNEIPGMTTPAFNIDASSVMQRGTRSVVFGYGSVARYKIETTAPWTFCGNQGRLYDACREFGYGTHTVTATSYSRNNGKGKAGKPISVTFTIVQSRAPSPAIAPVAGPQKGTVNPPVVATPNGIPANPAAASHVAAPAGTPKSGIPTNPTAGFPVGSPVVTPTGSPKGTVNPPVVAPPNSIPANPTATTPVVAPAGAPQSGVLANPTAGSPVGSPVVSPTGAPKGAVASPAGMPPNGALSPSVGAPKSSTPVVSPAAADTPVSPVTPQTPPKGVTPTSPATSSNPPIGTPVATPSGAGAAPSTFSVPRPTAVDSPVTVPSVVAPTVPSTTGASPVTSAPVLAVINPPVPAVTPLAITPANTLTNAPVPVDAPLAVPPTNTLTNAPVASPSVGSPINTLTDAPIPPSQAPAKATTQAPAKAPSTVVSPPTTAPQSPDVSPIMFQPILINSGGGDYVDSLGRTWIKDTYFTGGSGYCAFNPIAGTVHDSVYQCERYGNVAYDIPLPKTGSYSVTLHFAEIYHDNVNSRVFDVSVEGTQYPNIDLFALAGKNHAYTITTTVVVTDGVLSIAINTILDSGKISGIEIHDTNRPTVAPSSAPTTWAPHTQAVDGQCRVPRLQGNKWQDARPYPLNVAEAQGMMIGSTFVIYGGLKGDWVNASKSTYTLDTSDPTAAWEKVDDIPITEGLTHGAHVHIGSKIYNCGGYVGGHPGLHTTTCIVYDQSKPLGQRWTTMAPLPDGRGGGGMFYSSTLNAMYYVSGAQRYKTPFLETLDFNSTFMYSFTNSSSGWVRKADLPYASNHMMAVTTKDATGKERHYAFGGQYRENECCGNYAENYEYDALNDVWIRRADMQYPRAHATSSTHALGCGFVAVAGNTNEEKILSNVTYYNVDTDTWTDIGNVPYILNTPICDINRNTNVMYCETGRLWTSRSYSRQLLL